MNDKATWRSKLVLEPKTMQSNKAGALNNQIQVYVYNIKERDAILKIILKNNDLHQVTRELAES